MHENFGNRTDWSRVTHDNRNDIKEIYTYYNELNCTELYWSLVYCTARTRALTHVPTSRVCRAGLGPRSGGIHVLRSHRWLSEHPLYDRWGVSCATEEQEKSREGPQHKQGCDWVDWWVTWDAFYMPFRAILSCIISCTALYNMIWCVMSCHVMV